MLWRHFSHGTTFVDEFDSRKLRLPTMALRFRAEQVGSLLRPPELLQARAAHAESRLKLHELRAEEDRAIQQALEKQRPLGIDVLTDSEIRPGSWLTVTAETGAGLAPPVLAA